MPWHGKDAVDSDGRPRCRARAGAARTVRGLRRGRITRRRRRQLQPFLLGKKAERTALARRRLIKLKLPPTRIVRATKKLLPRKNRIHSYTVTVIEGWIVS